MRRVDGEESWEDEMGVEGEIGSSSGLIGGGGGRLGSIRGVGSLQVERWKGGERIDVLVVLEERRRRRGKGVLVDWECMG